jgi:biopolymer transport protein ExbD
MRFKSPIYRKHARIEIVPLIDVMFFLLASFMMVSLDMTKLENIRVNVPSATQVQSEFGADMIHVAVDKTGTCWVEKQPITLPDLYTVLKNRFHQNAQLPVYIGGDTDTRHGDMAAMLDLVRHAGIQKVAFTVTAEQTPGSAGAEH